MEIIEIINEILNSDEPLTIVDYWWINKMWEND